MSLNYVECNPVTRRSYSDKKTIYGTQQSTGITLRCGRNFHDEMFLYKFKDGETEGDHSYPITLSSNPDVVFPEPDKTGIIKIFDNWSALTKKQIECTCPFYNTEKGCLKALEIGKRSLPKPTYRISSTKKIIKEAKVISFTRACLLSVNNMKDNFEDVVLSYVQALKEETEDPIKFIDKEIEYLYEVFIFRKNGYNISVEVPKTLDEIEEDFFSSVTELNNDIDNSESKRNKVIDELGSKSEEELKAMYQFALENGLIKTETKSVDISEDVIENIIEDELKVDDVFEPEVDSILKVEDKVLIEEKVEEKKSAFDTSFLDDLLEI